MTKRQFGVAPEVGHELTGVWGNDAVFTDELELKRDIDFTIAVLHGLWDDNQVLNPFRWVVGDDWPDTHITIAQQAVDAAYPDRNVIVTRHRDLPAHPRGSISWYALRVLDPS